MKAFTIFSLVVLVACNSGAQNKEKQTTSVTTETSVTTKTMDSEKISLVMPQESGTTLYDAMKNRASIRDYADEGLTFDQRPFYPTEEERLFVSALDAGHYSQNVGLWAAANGMGAVPRGWTNGEKFLETIEAPKNYRAILAQTIGIRK